MDHTGLPSKNESLGANGDDANNEETGQPDSNDQNDPNLQLARVSEETNVATLPSTSQLTTMAAVGQISRHVIQKAAAAAYEGITRLGMRMNWNHQHVAGTGTIVTGSYRYRQITRTITQTQSRCQSSQSDTHSGNNVSKKAVVHLGDIPPGAEISGTFQNEVHIGNVASGAIISGTFMNDVKIDNVASGAEISGTFQKVVYMVNVESGAIISGTFMDVIHMLKVAPGAVISGVFMNGVDINYAASRTKCIE